MARLTGRDEYESLASGADGGRIRFGDYSVPEAIAWSLVPIGRSPSVRAEFELIDGQVHCRKVEVVSSHATRGVTTADLESLPGLERKALEGFRSLGARVVPNDGSMLDKIEALTPPARAVGEALKNRPLDELERVAEVYRANIGSRPVEAVELELGLKRRTADRRIKAARDAGLLPPTTQGKKNA